MTGKQIGGMIALAILALGLSSDNNQTANTIGKLILVLIGFVIVCCIVARILGRKPRKSSNPWKPGQTDQPVEYSSADGFISSLKRPLLSGTFVCKTCGASTSFKNELYPNTNCAYCGTSIPEIQNLIRRRDNDYQDALNLEHKLYNERRTHEENLELTKEQMQFSKEQLEIQERMEKERQIHQTKRAEMAWGFIGFVLLLLLLLIFRNR